MTSKVSSSDIIVRKTMIPVTAPPGNDAFNGLGKRPWAGFKDGSARMPVTPNNSLAYGTNMAKWIVR